MKPVLTTDWFDAHVRAKESFTILLALHDSMNDTDFSSFLIGFLAGIEYCVVPVKGGAHA